jgi:hypothetical protein
MTVTLPPVRSNLLDEFCFSSESNKLCCIGAARMKQSTVSRRT